MKYEVTIDFPSGEHGQIQLDVDEDEVISKWDMLGRIISCEEQNGDAIMEFQRRGGFIIPRQNPIAAKQYLNPLMIEKITIVQLDENYLKLRRRFRE